LSQRRLNILIVEDIAINAMVVKSILEMMGHKITVAENGQVAIGCHLEDDFDAILMDIHMPVMNGLAATTVIRAMDDEYKASIPIIGLSADNFEGTTRAGKHAGMTTQISKPVHKGDLVAALMQYARPAKTAFPE
jgi:CheY-like chemotaxis protein